MINVKISKDVPSVRFQLIKLLKESMLYSSLSRTIVSLYNIFG